MKQPARQTQLQRYTQDEAYHKARNDLVNTKVHKHFVGYGGYKGIITAYYPKSDTYHILYEDGDQEVDNFSTIQKYIEGTPKYNKEQEGTIALTVSLDAAITKASNHHILEPNHYKDAMRTHYSEQWWAACDLEMKKLRESNCWTVVSRAEIPKNTKIMGGKWTFKYKRDEKGKLS